MTYTPLSSGIKFGNWLYSAWNFPSGWRGPYVQLRTVGFRLFGWEFEHIEERTAD